MPKVWVRNESTGLERAMEETSFKYHENKKQKGSNVLRPKFTFIRKVEEPKTEIQKEMDRLKAEKAAKDVESNAVVVSEQNSTTTISPQPAKRGPKAKAQQA